MIVHILHVGQALCGQKGTPDQWPDGHVWVFLYLKDQATCETCIKIANGVPKK